MVTRPKPTSAAKKEFMNQLKGHADRVTVLAQLYEKTGEEKTRKELNRENLHLNGMIHVFQYAMETKAQKKALSDIQLEVNKAIENAAKNQDEKVSYLDLEWIRTADKSMVASEHIYERAMHNDSSSPQKLRDSIEIEVRDELRQKGFENEEFLNRLFAMALLLKEKKERMPPAAQIGETSSSREA